jgi:hypothetical protein
MPSDAALLVAETKALEVTDVHKDIERYRFAFARFIEEHAPHLLRDPLEVVLFEIDKTFDSNNYAGRAAELRKRGVKMEGEGA